MRVVMWLDQDTLVETNVVEAARKQHLIEVVMQFSLTLCVLSAPWTVWRTHNSCPKGHVNKYGSLVNVPKCEAEFTCPKSRNYNDA